MYRIFNAIKAFFEHENPPHILFSYNLELRMNFSQWIRILLIKAILLKLVEKRPWICVWDSFSFYYDFDRIQKEYLCATAHFKFHKIDHTSQNKNLQYYVGDFRYIRKESKCVFPLRACQFLNHVNVVYV